MIFALTTHDIDEVIFHVASVLQIPVLILALLALALVIFELGSYLVEVTRRRKRRFETLSEGADRARSALLEGDRGAAERAVSAIPRSPAMARTLAFIIAHARTAEGDLSSTRRWPISTSSRSGGLHGRGCSSGPARRWGSWAR